MKLSKCKNRDRKKNSSIHRAPNYNINNILESANRIKRDEQIKLEREAKEKVQALTYEELYQPERKD